MSTQFFLCRKKYYGCVHVKRGEIVKNMNTFGGANGYVKGDTSWFGWLNTFLHMHSHILIN